MLQAGLHTEGRPSLTAVDPEMGMNGQEISVMVGGVDVRGVITHRSGSDIDVRITSPFRNISMGLHLMYQAMAVCSYSGEYGDATAGRLLRNIYDLGLFLEKELPRLQEQYTGVRAEIERSVSNDVLDDLCKRRLELRNSLKRGQLDGRSYQKELVSYRKALRELETLRCALLRSFLDSCFPMVIPWDTAHEVIAILEGRSELHPRLDGRSSDAFGDVPGKPGSGVTGGS